MRIRTSLAAVTCAATAVLGTAGAAGADSGAEGQATGSAGPGSGNHVQAPVHAPVNYCNNSVNVGGAGNPATGTTCTGG